MFDKVLTFMAIFDWIGPLIAMIRDWREGAHFTFLIPRSCGWAGVEIEKLLRDMGIETWGLMVIGDQILLTVRWAQARWAQYLLERAKISLDNGVPRDDGRDDPRRGVVFAASKPKRTPPEAGPAPPEAGRKPKKRKRGRIPQSWLDEMAGRFG